MKKPDTEKQQEQAFMKKYTFVKFTKHNPYTKEFTKEYCLIDKADIVEFMPPHSLVFSYDGLDVATTDSHNPEKNYGHYFFALASTNNTHYGYGFPKIDRDELLKIIGDRDEIEVEENHPIIKSLFNKLKQS